MTSAWQQNDASHRDFTHMYHLHLPHCSESSTGILSSFQGQTERTVWTKTEELYADDIAGR